MVLFRDGVSFCSRILDLHLIKYCYNIGIHINNNIFILIIWIEKLTQRKKVVVQANETIWHEVNILPTSRSLSPKKKGATKFVFEAQTRVHT